MALDGKAENKKRHGGEHGKGDLHVRARDLVGNLHRDGDVAPGRQSQGDRAFAPVEDKNKQDRRRQTAAHQRQGDAEMRVQRDMLSIIAASSSSRGVWSMKLFSIQVESGTV